MKAFYKLENTQMEKMVILKSFLLTFIAGMFVTGYAQERSFFPSE